MSRKHLLSVLRWCVAAAGTWYVLAQLSWSDRALVLLDSTNIPHWATVISGSEDSSQLIVQPWDTGKTVTVDGQNVVSEPDRKKMTVDVHGTAAPLLGVDLPTGRVLVKQGSLGQWIPIDQTDYKVTLPHARVQVGVRHLLAAAKKAYLFWSLAIFPLTFLITSLRWHKLLKALEIRLTFGRSFVLNMVGAFYSTFMLGSTGGDFLKAYYVAKQTHHRTRAVISVAVDRIIGLLALILLAGVMAAYSATHGGVSQTAGVAIFCAIVIAATAVWLTIFYNRTLRRFSGLEWVLARLPMRERVGRAVEALHRYGRRPGLAAAALLISFPVHVVVIVSAMLAGLAFGLHIPLRYYWTVVPVTVLAASIPISPQGAGVMEYFAIWLLAPVGCTVAEAVALTMSIRLVQVLWNLTGSVFVLRGGYHAPTAQERQTEAQEPDEDEVPSNVR